MSTKIYNGYKINITSLYKLNEFCQELGQKIKQKREELIQETYCELIQELLVTICSSERSEKLENYNYTLIGNIFNFLKKEKESKRRNIYDFGFNVMFFPFKTKTLAMLFCEKKEFIEIWEEYDCVDEYVYFNNTDKPDHISKRHWTQRRKEWDVALKYDIPSLSGLQFIPRIEYDLFVFENELKVFEDMSKFINRQSYDNLLNKFLKIHNYNYEEHKISGFFDFKKVFDKYIKESIGKRKLNIEKLKLKKRLFNWEKVKFENIFEINKTLFWRNNQ